VIHFLVDAQTSYAAVAKGTTAARFLASSHDQPIDDTTLIYDLDEEPAAQLTERWPTLPAAAEVASTAGDALLSAAHELTACEEDGKSDRPQKEIPRIYDECGEGIRKEASLETLLDGHDQGWIVPAIALETVTSDAEAPSPRTEIPTVTSLECRHCTRETDHRSKTRESLPVETRTGQPIWECQVCGTARYGPAPE
jgi:hypothetical protein